MKVEWEKSILVVWLKITRRLLSMKTDSWRRPESAMTEILLVKQPRREYSGSNRKAYHIITILEENLEDKTKDGAFTVSTLFVLRIWNDRKKRKHLLWIWSYILGGVMVLIFFAKFKLTTKRIRKKSIILIFHQQ